MKSTIQQGDEGKHQKLYGYVEIAGHCLAVISLLWSTYYWLLFLDVNASEEPAGPTENHLLVASAVSLMFAILAASVRSKARWYALAASLVTFFVQLSYIWS
jgi:hypothetical protein